MLSLDGPTASLSTQETENLFDIIEELKEKGITILYISHRLDEIFRIADRATVMRDGQYIGTYRMEDMTKEKLIYSMVGRGVEMFAARQKPSRVDKSIEVLRIEGLDAENHVENVSFNLYQGQILGFFGLIGAGRTGFCDIAGSQRGAWGGKWIYGFLYEFTAVYRNDGLYVNFQRSRLYCDRRFSCIRCRPSVSECILW